MTIITKMLIIIKITIPITIIKSYLIKQKKKFEIGIYNSHELQNTYCVIFENFSNFINIFNIY